jgi:hypothetical protein
MNFAVFNKYAIYDYENKIHIFIIDFTIYRHISIFLGLFVTYLHIFSTQKFDILWNRYYIENRNEYRRFLGVIIRSDLTLYKK